MALPASRLDETGTPPVDLDGFEGKFRGFSCAPEPIDEPFYELISIESAKDLAQRFLDEHGATVARSSDGLVEVIARWARGQSGGSDPVWDPAFGDAYRTLGHAADADVLATAAAIGLALSAATTDAHWRISLAREHRLRWDPFVLPAARELAVSVDGDDAQVTLAGRGARHRIALRRDAGTWQTDDAPRMRELELEGRRIALLPRDTLLFGDHDLVVGSQVADIDAGSAAVLAEAIAIIGEHAPCYLPWVRRAVHHVFLLVPKPKILESGTIEQYPGTIHLSACDRPMPVAELLVHEASHLHAYTLSRLGAVQDGSDTRVYYSPPVKAYRRLTLVAIAYHAFANIALFYRMCLDAGIPDRRHCVQELAKITDLVEPLEAPLVDNPALTVIGRSLCDPLRERVPCRSHAHG